MAGKAHAICSFIKCKLEVKEGEKAMLCDGCLEWIHIGCAEITAKDYQLYQCLDKCRGINWVCKKCLQIGKKGRMRKPSNNDSQEVETLRAKIIDIEKKCENLERVARERDQQNKSLAQKNKQVCEKDLVIEALTQEIKQLRENQIKMDDIDKMLEKKVEEQLEEKWERDRRKSFIIVHGLKENQQPSSQDRAAEDHRSIEEVLNTEFQIKDAVVANDILRLGRAREDGKPRLLRIRINSYKARKELLEKAKTIRHSQNLNNRRMYFTPDLTPKEREKQKKLKEELLARRAEGEENLKIRRGEIIRFQAPEGEEQQGETRGNREV